MKITHINTFTEGGAATASIRLHKKLLKLPVTTNFLSTSDPSSPFLKNTNYIKSLQTKLEFLVLRVQRKIKPILNSYKEEVPFFWSPCTPLRIHAHPLVQQADILHFHWVTYFLDFPSFFKHNKKPIVWTLHDMQPFTGGFSYKSDFPFQQYQKTLNRYSQIKKEALKDQNIHIVSLCQHFLELSKNSELMGQFPHYLIPNGIDTQLFKPYTKKNVRKLLNLPLEKKIVLFVASNIKEKRKGFDYLIKALKKIDNEQLVLVTIGAHGNFADTIPNLNYLGIIKKNSLLAQIYSAVDVFVIPSIEDNLPNTVLESISCGTPVVGFKIGGIPDMIKDGKNGLLVSKIEENLLAKKIKEALSTDWDRNWIRQDAVTRYDVGIQAARYIKLYKEILNQETNK